MKRRNFIKKAGLTAAAAIAVPYILPSGRLFAATGNRVANHVVFVLFAGGIRNQESVLQQYLANQGLATQGNIMENMIEGAAPSSNLVHQRWTPVTQPLSKIGTLFSEVKYSTGPTGHYNGHTVAMTGNYTNTGLNLNINPEFPTVFEYYRKHTDPAKSAINAWWLSEGLGPYPSLNYSRHAQYGSQYGANYLRPATTFGSVGQNHLSNIQTYQPDDVARVNQVRDFLNKNFKQEAGALPGIQNSDADREKIKAFITSIYQNPSQFEFPTPTGTQQGMTGDLINIAATWQVLKTFKPELTVMNTFNVDICHTNFSNYIQLLHKADYGIGWLWNKIQSDPVLKNDTILICMPEHGRNLQPNNLVDNNGLRAYDHTSDNNSRNVFTLIVGPVGKVNQDKKVGSAGNPVGESIDIIPTIAHILGFKNDIPGGMLPGRVLTEAFA